MNLLYVFVLSFTHYVLVDSSLEYEKILHRRLLKNYITDVRPEGGHNKPMEVHFDMTIQALVDLVVKNQVLIINAFTMMRWYDPQLRWNATEMNGIETINIGRHLIWTPDIVLYNTASPFSVAHTDLYKTKTLVNHDGTVIWNAPVTWKASCSLDVTWFPIDKQACRLTFGSWTYNTKRMKLAFWGEGNNGDTDHMLKGHFTVTSGEWEITKMTASNNNLSFSCCPVPFSTISYDINVSRMSLYYFLYIILPLISQIILFFMIFYIPHDSGERLGFGVTILLSITVYLLVISERLPEKSDNRPMLGLCFICEFYVLSAALIASGITIALWRKTSEPPTFMVNIINRRNKPKEDEAIPMRPANGYLQRQNSDSKDESEKERDFVSEWHQIAVFIDKISFIIFLFLTVFLPGVIVLALDKTALGGA